MPENLHEESGSKKDEDLNFRLKAQKLLDKFEDDQSINVVGKRIIRHSDK